MSNEPSHSRASINSNQTPSPPGPDADAGTDTHNASTVLPATVTYRAADGDAHDLQGERLGDYELF